MHPAKFPSYSNIPFRAILFAALTLPFVLHFFIFRCTLRVPTTLAERSTVNELPNPPLTVVTLAFGSVYDSPKVLEHNCAIISQTRHKYIIYTKNVSQSLCKKCTCKRFIKSGCPCPHPGLPQCNLCEKLRFFVDRIKELDEMLFLDADLVILRPDFLDRLYPRTRVHDALAAYAPVNRNVYKNQATLNSGLLFMRRLDGLDYEEMIRKMYQDKRNDDQLLVSWFLFKNYDNWDSLSVRWHCRFLEREGYDIHPRRCYTLHDRGALKSTLQRLNYTLLRME